MRALARHFEADEDEWGLVGLLHDADYEVTEKDPDRHMHVIVERGARGRGIGADRAGHPGSRRPSAARQ